jgi:orotidine-5'-phosphate decarboxylase
MFKVGLQLFTAEGPGIVRRIMDAGERVFLDLKLHDIPNTVQRAAREAARLGVAMFDVHAGGGAAMIRAAREALDDLPDRPLLLGVTVLTSLENGDLEALGVHATAMDHAVALARLGQQAGLDGVVASPHEIAAIKAACGERFLVVTPGIRPAGSAMGDQKRVTGPAEALAAGADCLVIGRPILEAPDPLQALERILREIGT